VPINAVVFVVGEVQVAFPFRRMPEAREMRKLEQLKIADPVVFFDIIKDWLPRGEDL
jgi:hypothetical protein